MMVLLVVVFIIWVRLKQNLYSRNLIIDDSDYCGSIIDVRYIQKGNCFCVPWTKWAGTLTIYNYKGGNIVVKNNNTASKEDKNGLRIGYSVYLDGKWIGDNLKNIWKDKVIYL